LAVTTGAASSNEEQAKYWSEEGGLSWVRDQQLFDLMLSPFNTELRQRLNLQSGERVLEIGCGFGSTALDLAQSGASVHGVDISPPMIQRAQERARESDVETTFLVADAQEDPLGGPYDAAVSRFGVMFFADPVQAFRNIASSMKPSGRLAFVCWQPLERNPWINAAVTVLRDLLDDPPVPAAADAPGPFAFADPDRTRAMLGEAGWVNIMFESYVVPIRLGGENGIAGAVDHALSSSIARKLLALGTPSLRQSAAEILHEQFSGQATDGVVYATGSTWIFTADR
jgi:SAM-dependent methyltransferase